MAFIVSFTGIVHSKSCSWDYKCAEGKCCVRINVCLRKCPCTSDRHCGVLEKCGYSGGVLLGYCYTPVEPPSSTEQHYTWNPATFKPFTWKPSSPSSTEQHYTWNPVTSKPFAWKLFTRTFFTQKRLTISPYNNYCVTDIDCRGSLTCQNGKCVVKKGKKGFGGILIIVVVVSFVMALFAYFICKKTRKTSLHQPAEQALRGHPQTEIATSGAPNVHEMQSGTVVVPPDVPPPYNTLVFERQENDNEDLPEQPPPSYNEAVSYAAFTV